MSDINVQQVGLAPGGYSLSGKKVMVHDLAAPLESSTVMYPASALGGGGGYAAPMWKESDGDMTAGQTTFTNAALVDATELTYIIVNKVIEFVDEDFTFDNSTGTIDRSPNEWQSGDKMITPFKAAEVVLP